MRTSVQQYTIEKQSMNTILALDLGTNTGWAIMSGSITTGVEKFSNNRHCGGGMRYLKFRRWLDDLWDNSGFSEVYYEEVHRHLGTDAAHTYGGFLATLQAWCEDRDIAYQGVGVGTIKKFATGHGGASKEAMVAAAKAERPYLEDDNEVDAYWLLRCVTD